MIGTPPNENPESFFKADFDEAVARLLHIIQDVHPQVLVTYNERGGYGHPDHIMANKITTAAFHKAKHGDTLPVPQKLYYLGTPLSLMRQRHQLALERGQKPRMNPELLGTPDALITTAIDVESYIPKKFAALACHKSQMGPNSFFRQVSEDRIKEYFKYEYYVCVEGCGENRERETDFFEAVNLE
jgi:LmbE family N-acetylglucosaminyl deacetylase